MFHKKDNDKAIQDMTVMLVAATKDSFQPFKLHFSWYAFSVLRVSL